jgi:Tfp pilus assembly protein PilP
MKNFELKDKILLGGIVVLILLLMMSNCSKTKSEREFKEQLRQVNKGIVENSKIIKEKDGQYSKLVNNFNSQKDLLKELKSENKELFKTIKKNDEKILMINKNLITLQGKIDEGFGKWNPTDSNLIDLDLTYPNKEDWFISWKGSVHKKTTFYKGEWSFDTLPLKIVLTETKEGLWNSRLIGPEWLTVSDMEINALDPSGIVDPYVPKQRNIGFILGGGYVRGFDDPVTNNVSLGLGAYYKNHSFIVNGVTNKTIGFNYYYRFITFKKK